MIQAEKSSDNLLEAVCVGMANLIERWRYFLSHPATIHEGSLTPQIEEAMSDLRARGHAVIPNYYSRALCERLCSEIDRIIAEQPEIIQNDPFAADQRIFGSDRASADIGAFNRDPFLLSVGQSYSRRQLTAFSTLAGRIEAKPGNLGSGQGWHRDAFHFQFKAMVYLTDVGADHGPFQMIEGSHHGAQMFADTVRGRLPRSPRSRVTAEQAQRLLLASSDRLKTFCAPAGTLIL